MTTKNRWGPSPKRLSVLDHGYIELRQSMGDDLNIVNAARQSFGNESTELGKAEKGLINFLMRERHGTPFEMVQFLFNIKLPIFVMREWRTHRWSSFNEYSGRYSKMMTETYMPKNEYVRTQTGKPGAYVFEPMDVDEIKDTKSQLDRCYDYAYRSYEQLLERGVAKELARTILPVGGYTSFTWSINLRSLLNFISLRSDDTAMLEIRQYSKTIEQLIEPIVPTALEVFNKHGRYAP